MPAQRVRCRWSATCSAASALCGHCQLGPSCSSAATARSSATTGRAPARDTGAVTWPLRRPRAGVPRSRCGSSPPATAASSPCSTARTSCSPSPSGWTIAYFLEATSAAVEGPYDLSLVEGSITTPDDASGSSEVRRESRRLVTIGACATAGGIQALRNFADVGEFASVVYARPEYIAHPGDLDPDRRPRAGRLRAARLPDRPPPAARGDRAPSWPAASRASPPTASASSASAAATSASWSRTARRASGRSPTPAAARSARPATAAATAASGRWRRRTPRRWPARCAGSGWASATCVRAVPDVQRRAGVPARPPTTGAGVRTSPARGGSR